MQIRLHLLFSVVMVLLSWQCMSASYAASSLRAIVVPVHPSGNASSQDVEDVTRYIIQTLEDHGGFTCMRVPRRSGYHLPSEEREFTPGTVLRDALKKHPGHVAVTGKVTRFGNTWFISVYLVRYARKQVFSATQVHRGPSGTLGMTMQGLIGHVTRDVSNVFERSAKEQVQNVPLPTESSRFQLVAADDVSNQWFMAFLPITGKPYQMQTTEVTVGQWKAVMNELPGSGPHSYSGTWGQFARDEREYPVVFVSWHDAVRFCETLSEQDPFWTYRLPTEAEWTHACLAGASTTYCFGDRDVLLDEYAWFTVNTWDVGEQYAHKVGRKRPNYWGLYDMHGNVWEWCSDRVKNGRVIRGGSWLYQADTCTAASRYGYAAEGRDRDVGFRTVREQKRTHRTGVLRK